MKKAISILLIVLVLVTLVIVPLTGCADGGGQVSRTTGAAAQSSGSSPVQWEYRWDWDVAAGQTPWRERVDSWNELGAEGWQLVTVVRTDQHGGGFSPTYIAFFKRMLP